MSRAAAQALLVARFQNDPIANKRHSLVTDDVIRDAFHDTLGHIFRMLYLVILLRSKTIVALQNHE